MVAVVLPSLKFAPPARGTVTALAWAHAGSAAPAARSGALATLTAMTGSAADASKKKPDMATMAIDNNARLLAIHMLLGRLLIGRPIPYPTGRPILEGIRSPLLR